MSFFQWLQLLFVALKLMGYIDWTWCQVLIPTAVQISLIAIGSIATTFEKYE